MSTVKITQLPALTSLDANTANSLFMGVDVTSGVTGKFTAHTLAQGLFSNEILNVGNNSVVFPNTIAQFAGNSETYLQINLQNFDSLGSGDFVITADTGTDANGFINLGINNSNFSDPDFSAMSAYDGYLYVEGPANTGAVGNLIIGSSASGSGVKFVAGGTTDEDIVAEVKHGGLYLQNGHGIRFEDGSTQTHSATFAEAFANGAFVRANSAYAAGNTLTTFSGNAYDKANSGATFANSAFTRANSGYSQANSAASFANGAFVMANSGYGQANSAASFANGAFLRANSSYEKANAALANTTGTFDGDLTITGNLRTTGVVTLNNSSFPSENAFVSIVASDNFATVAPSNTNYMLHITGKANSVTRVVVDSFGQTTYPLFAGRMGRGSAAEPLAAANNDILLRIVSNGYTGTQFPSSSPTKIDFVASENFSDTNRGTRIEFWNTEIGSNTIQRVASFNANMVEFTGSVNPTKGFIYTPRVLQGAQTAITIDFATDSMVRGTFSTSLTNSFTNYIPGKVVEVWLTNTAGNGQTITHGCLGNNSTTGSTTLSVAAGRSALLKYFSIDGDNANTFVAITYA